MATANLGLTLPTVGASSDTWGDTLNADLNIIDTLYANGSFTPTDASGAALTFTSAVGRYRKSLGSVLIAMKIVYPVTASGASAVIGALPFTALNLSGFFFPLAALPSGGGLAPGIASVVTNTVTANLIKGTGAALLNSDMSGNTIYITGEYPL